MQLAHRVGHGRFAGAAGLGFGDLVDVSRIGNAGREFVEDLVGGVFALAEGGKK